MEFEVREGREVEGSGNYQIFMEHKTTGVHQGSLIRGEDEAKRYVHKMNEEYGGRGWRYYFKPAR